MKKAKNQHPLTPKQIRKWRFVVVVDANNYRRIGRIVDIVRGNGLVYNVKIVWGFKMHGESEVDTLCPDTIQYMLPATRVEIRKFREDIKQRIGDMLVSLDTLQKVYNIKGA